MKEDKDNIRWKKESRKFVEEKISMSEAIENMRNIVNELEKIRIKTPEGYARRSIREDRDSR